MRIKGLTWEGYWTFHRDAYWNRLDFTLVSLSLGNFVIDILGGSSLIPMDPSYFRILRFVKVVGRLSRVLRSMTRCLMIIPRALGLAEGNDSRAVREAAVASRSLTATLPFLHSIMLKLEGWGLHAEYSVLEGVILDAEDPRWVREDGRYSSKRELRERDRKYARDICTAARMIRQGMIHTLP